MKEYRMGPGTPPIVNAPYNGFLIVGEARIPIESGDRIEMGHDGQIIVNGALAIRPPLRHEALRTMTEAEARELFRQIDNRYRKALRFARSSSAETRDAAEAVVAALRWERRIAQARIRKSGKR